MSSQKTEARLQFRRHNINSSVATMPDINNTSQLNIYHFITVLEGHPDPGIIFVDFITSCFPLYAGVFLGNFSTV